jgi:predicted TIM-barrel fold metal-dependent hydrolase
MASNSAGLQRRLFLTGPNQAHNLNTVRFLLSLSCALACAVGAPRAAHAQPLVDHHQHLFGPAVLAPAPNVQPITTRELLMLLDSARIRRAVVLSVAYQFGNPNGPPLADEYERVRAENDWTAGQVARAPSRLTGFCSVNPLKDYALGEIARCAANPHLRTGLKLHFGNSDVDLNDPAHVNDLRRVFAAANGRGMAIVVHMRSSVTKNRPYGAADARRFVSDLLPAAPDVPVQIAHLVGAGGYDDPQVDEALGVFADAIAAGDNRMTRVYFDVSGVAGLGNWRSRADAIAARIRQLGLARVLYGSDGAGGGNNTPREAWAAFRRLPLTPAELLTIASNVAPYLE